MFLDTDQKELTTNTISSRFCEADMRVGFTKTTADCICRLLLVP